ncbi:hypothetical protein HYV88_05350 [Candidatus Woesearchaeota archaeon]|nr:hypothetical protein [Candidatus Woesearchaeota archaeon]
MFRIKKCNAIGYARYRLREDQSPRHEEIKKFAEKISKLTDFKIIDEQPPSQVVLMTKKEDKDFRFLGV